MSNCTLNQTQGEKDIFIAAVYSLVFIAGLILNLLALLVFFCQSKSRSHTTVYMTNLAIADILLVCTLPFRIYFYCGFELTQKICNIASLILLINMYGTIFLLTCICLDRCLAVCFPLSPRVREGRKKAPLVCVGIWMLTAGASLPTYIFRRYNVTESNNGFGSIPEYAVQKTALSATFVIGFGIPLVTMVLCSWGLVQAIKKSTAVQTDDMVNSRKIQKMICANLTIFLFCFLPYHAMLGVIYVYKNTECGWSYSVKSAYKYSLMIACMNATLDPLAYYFTTETFRKNVDMDAMRRMWPLNNQSSEGNNRSRVPLNT